MGELKRSPRPHIAALSGWPPGDRNGIGTEGREGEGREMKGGKGKGDGLTVMKNSYFRTCVKYLKNCHI